MCEKLSVKTIINGANKAQPTLVSMSRKERVTLQTFRTTSAKSAIITMDISTHANGRFNWRGTKMFYSIIFAAITWISTGLLLRVAEFAKLIEFDNLSTICRIIVTGTAAIIGFIASLNDIED